MRGIIRIYKLQGIQIVYMGFMSFVMPLIIGIEEYGRYASYFSIPGFFMGLTELLGFTSGSKKENLMSSFHSYLTVCLISIVGTSVISLFLNMSLIYLILLLIPSLVKNWIYGVLAQIDLDIVEFMFKVETYFLFSSITSVLCIFLLGVDDFRLPILVYFAGQATVILVLYPRYFSLNLLHSYKLGRISLSVFLRRSYEDFFITLYPLFISMNYGNHIAGSFRLNISLMKALSKLVPLRYELFVRDIDYQFSKRKYFFFFVILLSLSGLFFLSNDLILYLSNLPFDKYLFWIIAPAILLLVVSPVLTAYYPQLTFWNTITFLLSAVFMSFLDYKLFTIIYTFIAFFLLFVHYYYLSQKIYEK